MILPKGPATAPGPSAAQVPCRQLSPHSSTSLSPTLSPRSDPTLCPHSVHALTTLWPHFDLPVSSTGCCSVMFGDPLCLQPASCCSIPEHAHAVLHALPRHASSTADSLVYSPLGAAPSPPSSPLSSPTPLVSTAHSWHPQLSLLLQHASALGYIPSGLFTGQQHALFPPLALAVLVQYMYQFVGDSVN